MSNLTVISVVEGDHGTFDLMVRSILKFTNPTPKFVICCNDHKESTNIFDLYSGANTKIIFNDPIFKTGSNRHGSGLNAAFALVNTKYTAIVESDCIVLNKNWCNIKTPLKIMAAKKGPELYHVCFLVFETEILRGIDFRPGTNKTRANRSYKAEEDVGWAIKNFVKKDQIDLVDFVDCKTDQAKIFKSFQSDEFYKNGEIICAHFGRGSNLAGKASRKGFETATTQLKKWKEIANRLIND